MRGITRKLSGLGKREGESEKGGGKRIKVRGKVLYEGQEDEKVTQAGVRGKGCAFGVWGANSEIN